MVVNREFVFFLCITCILYFIDTTFWCAGALATSATVQYVVMRSLTVGGILYRTCVFAGWVAVRSIGVEVGTSSL